MRYEEFERRAREVFEEIPEDFKDGVDGLEVTRRTVTHPSLPEVYTLGECLSEFYPSEFGGPGEVRSRVVLYYGSFLALSRTDEAWDWEEEIWETITHEIRHHLEHLASEDALEAMDYADDQNFARREGKPFDPFFHHSGEQLDERVYTVDRDVFIEVEVDSAAAGQVIQVPVPRSDDRFRVRVPEDPGDIHFLRLEEPPFPVGGDLLVVILRRRGALERIRGLLRRDPPRVRESEAAVERDNAPAQ